MNTVKCPHCKKNFELDQVFKHQVEEDIKTKIEAELAKKFEEKNKIELLDLQKQLDEKNKKVDELRQQELDLRGKTRKIEEKEKEFELQMKRTLDEERKKIEEETSKKEEEKHHLKDLEKEKVIQDLKKSLEDAQRKAAQGSQQIQGEAFELEFENILKREFPNDNILEVAKGTRGGDIIQEVIDRNGVFCGKILWELKNTKAWSELWIDKLKTDQRSITAESAVIVSEAVPDGVESAKFHKGVWIAKRAFVLGLAYSLRLSLIQIGMAKRAMDGRKEKTDILFTYLSGTEFKHRVEAILEAWTSMQLDIEKEKRYFAGKWARDDKNIRHVIDSTLGMRGDLESIMGNVLPEIKGLEMLEEETPKNSS